MFLCRDCNYLQCLFCTLQTTNPYHTAIFGMTNIGQVFNSKLDSFANVHLKFVSSKQKHVPLPRLELLAIVFLERTNSYHTAIFGMTNIGQVFNSKLVSVARYTLNLCHSNSHLLS